MQPPTRRHSIRLALALVLAAPSWSASLDAQAEPETTAETRSFARQIVEAVVESATGLPTALVLPEAHVSWHANRVGIGGAAPSTMAAAVRGAAADGRVDPGEEFRLLRRYAEEYRAGREVFGVTLRTHCLASIEPAILATHDFDITYQVEYSGGDAYLYRMRVAAVRGPEGLYLGSRPGGATVDLVTGPGCAGVPGVEPDGPTPSRPQFSEIGRRAFAP